MNFRSLGARFRLLWLKTIEEPCLSQIGMTSVCNPMNLMLRQAHLTFLEVCFICDCIFVLRLHRF